ncbi:ribonuclease HI [Rubinisphaera margarita]|uniref:ribonuclease HI n=1 Tax=Rubinisphaera margarita TaxID=2909586 RepID=UPI001EE99488|nr:ribonuclease HI [Rubinisphaera margarita]MCG6155052.1 ribonuclease HI [Rubinisphaera margarita]
MTSSADTPADSSEPVVLLFTDGACKGNPGRGGWAYVLRHVPTSQEREASGGAAVTTNNQMELQAVIEGLEALTRPVFVEVVTDSQYVAKGCSEWLAGWKKNGWKRKEKGRLKPIKNEEHWRKLDALLNKHKVKLTWVRGHVGHPENERCDQLAVAAAEAVGNE